MMKSPTNRLILTIFGTILLPLIVYSVYEISSVKEGEEVIEKVYRDQLDAILFSVNQFSNDVTNSLVDKVEDRLTDSLQLDKMEAFLSFSRLKAILIQHEITGKRGVIVMDPAFEHHDWPAIHDELMTKSGRLPTQLIRYRENGYRKIEPQGRYDLNDRALQVVHAVLETSKGEHLIMTGLIDIQGFAEDVLAPKLQQIAEDDLIITLSEKESNRVIYQTDTLSKEVMFHKTMWLFPDFEVGISSRNKTVSELVEERTQYNLLAAAILIALLIFGFSLVVRNLRREMQLAQTKSDFVSNVSHELRTPLSLISLFAETLMLDRVPNWEKRKEYEEIIYKETHRLTNIVNKILNFSQIEGNRRIYHPTQVNINHLVDELIHGYKYHLERNGFTYEFWRFEELPLIQVDKEALYEALVNLVDNAIKYSPDRKHLILRTNRDGNRVYVELEDQGIGIEPGQIKQIFEKFYRVSEGNVHSTRGAGLGLTLVSHIVNSHGGDIEVESTPGKGSIFRLVFYLDKNGQNTGS